MKPSVVVCFLLLAACDPSSSSAGSGKDAAVDQSVDAAHLDGALPKDDAGGSATDDGGGSAAGDAGGTSSDDAGSSSADASTDDGCPITGDSHYVLGGASLFRATPDGRLAEFVAFVRTPSGGTVGSPVSTVRQDDWLVLSSPDCRFCKVDPAKVVNGEVNAEVIDAALSPQLLGHSAAPGTVLLVSGLKVSLYSLSTKTVLRKLGLTLGKTGVYCDELLDIEGVVTDKNEYDFKVLASCGDGNGGTFPTYAETNGTFTEAPATTTQDKFSVIAAALSSASTDAKLIELMDAQNEVFVGKPDLVFKLDGQGGFARDTMHPFRQCTKAGTAVVAPPVF